MKTLIDYVDDLKSKFGSDYKAFKNLKLSKSTISMIRKHGQCSDETALLIANALGENKENLLLAAKLARYENTIKKTMEKISKNASLSVNSFIALGVVRPALERAATSFFEAVKCILCKIGQCAKKRFFSYTEKSNSERTCHGFLFIAPGSWIDY